MSRIFISYRRDDSADITGRLYDRLVRKFGKQSVFKDVDDIPLGRDFRRALREAVGRCEVMLVVIGRQWLTVADDHRRRRLDNPGDFVRIEVESALDRNIPVIPVLVQGATMPRESDLPPSLAALAYRNGFALRADPYFHNDVSLLIARMAHALKPAATPQPPRAWTSCWPRVMSSWCKTSTPRRWPSSSVLLSATRAASMPGSTSVARWAC